MASAQEAATTTIKDFEVLHLRDQAREVFINAVLNPPAPNDAARAAAERYRKHMGL
jgi:ribosomal protein S18 acetylase RimI-like enzyme